MITKSTLSNGPINLPYRAPKTSMFQGLQQTTLFPIQTSLPPEDFSLIVFAICSFSVVLGGCLDAYFPASSWAIVVKASSEFKYELM